jgi:hypothetical protein
VLDHH